MGVLPHLEKILTQLRGNTSIIFAKGDLLEVKAALDSQVREAPARVGSIAPKDVTIKAGPTGIDPAQTSFFQKLDSFVDDATNRRLGNGSAFYGKRKSEFYGENDKGKKKNKKMADNTEDYNAPSAGGYFQWMQDEEGNMRPVTRMKKKIVENKRMKR